MCVRSDDVGLELLFLFFQEKRKGKNEPQPQMPAIAQAGVGMTWLLRISHHTHILGINKV